ncbi:hypothetical protein Kpol_1023p3 [Vanderwaltozyma polyspora DSM 70294]|uniref:L-type lectin-like domain-containing protein n=1 Tax=Vanderwaltozyma polyspora (strain ATCC 22028 / DSM 70294 / BCRC 21397 / CBS 2163 / NBRC 10782 / NRRL Y-8283 / UCD 57-17) TaxID=436907 RepID=A7TFM6_VANPO|nr:uncharacterized protein Kpol_1023p3 [Vanderwaltozyma polyspora DSM 70294]EDO18834.1 hypothetical protein Kpol_1023p3 [Vanderwaltozyma polyspora DSM 70294]
MKLAGLFILQVFALVKLVCSHPIDNTDEIKLNKDFSLTNVLNMKKIPDVWDVQGSSVLEEGRIILTPKESTKGSLWHKTSYPLGDSFTIEWTFRSVNHVGKSEGGLSFWFITGAQKDDQALFNGPSTYDGLQLLVDNNGPVSPSIRAILNDGSKPVPKADLYDKTFAYCLMGYQDSSVPSTLRLTYDRNDNNLLKLQVDNRVCFQTRKVQIPKGNYRIGVTADNGNTPEHFELFKMKTFDGVIEDSYIPNVNSMPQPKMITKVIDKDTGAEKLVEKTAFDAETEKISNYEIYRKLDRVEGKVLANDIHELETQIVALMKGQEDILKQVGHLTQALSNRLQSQDGESKTQVDMESFNDFIGLNEKLEVLLEESQKLREASKRTGQSGTHIDEIVRKLTIWIIPLIFIMSVMAYYTFRIRQEIIKTKLL